MSGTLIDIFDELLQACCVALRFTCNLCKGQSLNLKPVTADGELIAVLPCHQQCFSQIQSDRRFGLSLA